MSPQIDFTPEELAGMSEEERRVIGETDAPPASRKETKNGSRKRSSRRVDPAPLATIDERSQEFQSGLAQVLGGEVADAAAIVQAVEQQKEGFVEDASEMLLNTIKTVNHDFLERSVQKASAYLEEKKTLHKSRSFDFSSAFSFPGLGEVDTESD